MSGFRAAINICQGKTASSNEISIWESILNIAKKQKENTYLYLFDIELLHLTSVPLSFHLQNFPLLLRWRQNVQPDLLRGSFQQVSCLIDTANSISIWWQMKNAHLIYTGRRAASEYWKPHKSAHIPQIIHVKREHSSVSNFLRGCSELSY